MKTKIFAATALMAVASCGPSKEEISAKEADSARIAFAIAAVETVRRSAFDPSSAQFRDLKVETVEGKGMLCGEMNANNRYGAKAGFRAFVAGYSVDDPTELIAEFTRDAKTAEQARPCIKAWNDLADEEDPVARQRLFRVYRDAQCDDVDNQQFDDEFWIVSWGSCSAGSAVEIPPTETP